MTDPMSDNYERVLADVAARQSRSAALLKMGGTKADPTMLSIAHSLHAMTAMLHHAFIHEFDGEHGAEISAPTTPTGLPDWMKGSPPPPT